MPDVRGCPSRRTENYSWSYRHESQALALSDPSGISRAPHAQPFQRPRDDVRRPAGRAPAPEHAVCFAGLPLVQSTLLPGTMRELQQGQTEANLAVMIMRPPVLVGRARAQ